MSVSVKRCSDCHFSPCRCEDLASGQMLVGHSSSGWPRESNAFGCLRSQCQSQKDQWAKKGISVDFNPATGDCIVPDPQTQKRMLAVRGWQDLSREVTQPKRKTMKERSIRPRPSRRFSDTM